MAITTTLTVPEVNTTFRMKCNDESAHDLPAIQISATALIRVSFPNEPSNTELVFATLSLSSCRHYPGECVREIITDFPAGRTFGWFVDPAGISNPHDLEVIRKQEFKEYRKELEQSRKEPVCGIPQNIVSIHEMADKEFRQMKARHQSRMCAIL